MTRHLKRESPVTGTPETPDLLEKTRRGLGWLRRAHHAWLEDRPQSYPEEEFGRVLDETASMEKKLRSLGFKGCILGEQAPCPEDAVITCDRCAGILAPPEPEATSPTSSEPEGSQQLSLFRIPSQHP
jgi:hypothetical protein